MIDKHLIKRHIVILLAICLFVLILNLFEITCPIMYIFGIPCPTCGVSRAVISFIHLDFYGYMHYHPLAIPLVMSVFLMLHLKCFKRKRMLLAFVFFVLSMNLILYILRFNSLGAL